MPDRIPVVYILSSGHSGTTLLDLLLGAHPNIWTLGEAQLLPWELRDPDAVCGSGEPIQESVFWGEILEEIPTDFSGYHVGFFRNEKKVGQVLRWKLVPDLLRGTVSSRWAEPAAEYAEKNARYFRAARKEAQHRTGTSIDWLVDASKDPYRLLWLQASDQFDIRVVHALKDPRAFVYSMTKNELPWKANRVLRFAGRWIIENALMARLCRTAFAPENVWTQRYETLATAPEDTMATLGKWLGIEYDPERVHKFRDYENFAISGNMMRWRESEDDIRLDERWKRELPALYACFIDLIASPFRRVCGYERTDGKTRPSPLAVQG
jgi:hypothetical protein